MLKMKIIKLITILCLSFIGNLLYGQDNFQVDFHEVDSIGQLKWSTINEPQGIVMKIEQFRWNKWIRIGQINGGGQEKNNYTYKTSLHSGMNKFRIATDSFVSDIFEYTASNPDVGGWTKKVTKELTLESVSDYEIYDAQGNLKLKGKKLIIDVSSLSKGVYYLLMENSMEHFIKK